MKSSAMLALLPGIDRPLFRLRCLLLLPSRSLAGNWTISSVSADEEPTHSLTGRAAFGLKICFVDFFRFGRPRRKMEIFVRRQKVSWNKNFTAMVGKIFQFDEICIFRFSPLVVIM